VSPIIWLILMVVPHQPMRMEFTPLTTAGFVLSDASEALVICDNDGQMPYNCKLQSGHTLDEAMQAVVNSERIQKEAWEKDRADTEKRLCIAIDMIKILTHNKTKTPGCAKP